MAPFNTAVIGYGFSAKTFHIPFIVHNSGYRLYSIVQRSPTDKNSAKRDFPDVRVYHDAYEAINDPSADVVVITSTNGTHFPLARDALLAGKHVIVEKPFTVTYAEAAELVELAKKTERKLAVYHNRRWDSDFLTIQSLLTSPTNPLGDIIRFRSHFDCAPNSRTAIESRKWRLASAVPGAGMLFDLGSHLIDQVVVLFGTPERVNCSLFDEAGGKSIEDEGFVDDGFVILLGYDKGLNVELHSTQYSVSTLQKRFEILGRNGRWIKYGLDCQEEQLQNGILPGHEEYGLERADNQGTLQVVDGTEIRTEEWEPSRGGYQHFYENVRQAITGESELAVRPEQAALVMRLIELCRKSAVEGRTLDVDL
ncbi:oxidoreductase [Aspergillus pseudodeflectus]|uniref:Oxidoreductase n=1 Tax=Aspergillus pseudodeflectus TaxID=176178 RepID=A0ABR4JWJ6_9EURO